MNWVVNNLALIGDRTLAHLGLSIWPILLTFVFSVPLGWLANRLGPARGVFIGALGILYAIPSLAFFLILPLFIGGSLREDRNVIIVLTVYGIAIMARTTADAFRAVDPDIVQSATAVGFDGWRRFWGVEFPLSGPVLLAGMRVVSVSTVSLVTVSGALGTNNLGLLFLDGFGRNIPIEIVAGIVGVILIALVFDGILVLLGRLLMPWRTAVADPGGRASARTRRALDSEVAA